jgi:isopentenyl diphosphate isomerase/L-lactate dehydrogenase-like FMN-dependent dehydrogenase
VTHLLALLAAELKSVMQLSGVTTLSQLRENGPALLGDS